MLTEWKKTFIGLSPSETEWTCTSCKKGCTHRGTVKPDSCLYEKSYVSQKPTMKPFWTLFIKGNGEEHTFICYGCANQCQYVGLFKPTTCTGTPITETFD